jgi:hypothetical protein
MHGRVNIYPWSLTKTVGQASALGDYSRQRAADNCDILESPKALDMVQLLFCVPSLGDEVMP